MKPQKTSETPTIVLDWFEMPLYSKVKMAFMHKAPFIPGLNSETHFTQLKMPGIEMRTAEQGLIIKIKGHIALIPWANVSNLVFE